MTKANKQIILNKVYTLQARTQWLNSFVTNQPDDIRRLVREIVSLFNDQNQIIKDLVSEREVTHE